MFKATGINLLLLLVFSTVLLGQNNTLEAQWRRVYQYELQDLPKSASGVVDSIYHRAKLANDHVQYVKALIYKSKFILVLEEDAQLKVVQLLQKEIGQSQFPVDHILESVVANVYWQYFQQNRWQFYNRTRTKEIVGADFRAWGLKTIFAEIHHHFDRSLHHQQLLQKIDLHKYNELLVLKEGSRQLRPTLYDFLAHQALAFYKTDESSISKPTYQFLIDDPRYLQDLLAINLSAQDSTSLQFKALVIYQDLLRFHENDTDPTAKVMVALELLDFVKANATFPAVENEYLIALENLQSAHAKDTVSTDIDFKIASFYDELAQRYKPKTNEQHVLALVKALEICDAAIAKFPQSRGAWHCAILREKIVSKALELTAERYIPVNLPSRLLVSYRNMDSLNLRIYQVSKDEEEKWDAAQSDSAKNAMMRTLKVVKKWTVTLNNPMDYQTHRTEVVVPGLTNGNYLFVAGSTDGDFLTKGVFGYNFIQVTNLGLIENHVEENFRYQVVDRNTGKPLAGAKVHLSNRKHIGRKEHLLDQHFLSDKHGFVSFPGVNYFTNVEAVVSTKHDAAYFKPYYLYPQRNSADAVEERVFVRPFIFTDRGIYRPGQTVYFKGILIQRKGAVSQIVPSEEVEVYLEDVNGEEVETLKLKTNEFGSFSGQFTIPAGGLTGEYAIHAEEGSSADSRFYDSIMEEFEWLEHRIIVEEYKRPRFETHFLPINGVYQLHDTIAVIGTAAAFAGSNVSEAKVRYTVQRKTVHSSWYYWSRPRSGYTSEVREITHGETTTDAKGEFTIPFVAIPDLKVAADDLPVFHYEVRADVTDINGETRSATTVVKVGYHTLLAKLQIPEVIEKKEREVQVFITTENLNGQFGPLRGKLNIYKLQAPASPLRNRPWEAPDLPSITREEFKSLFRHDAYENEDDIVFWPKEKLVWSASFDTEEKRSLQIKGLEKWQGGSYIIELSGLDNTGKKVADKSRFKLTSGHKTIPEDNALFSIKSDQRSYRVGDEVSVTVGSSSDDVTIVLDIEKDQKVVRTELVRLNKGFKTIKVPVTKKDLGGFAIRYSFVNYNAFESGVLQISVPDEGHHLLVETTTFRDKLLPGEKQTWSFQIRGKRSDKVVAEVLASMYDASLDQFTPHDWFFSPVKSKSYSTYSNGRDLARQSFGISAFRVKNFDFNYRWQRRFKLYAYDEFNWFGFSMTGNRYVKSQYLSSLAVNFYTSTFRSSDRKNQKAGWVNGEIVDESGEPMVGVNVVVNKKTDATTSDVNGQYAIPATKGDILNFSFIGYAPVSARVDYNTIDVTMVADIMELSEVVVVGHGVEQKSYATGSVSSVELENNLSFDMEELQGQIPGLQVDYNSPNNANISLRGASPLSGDTRALYVVDGVVVDIFNLNPEDIVSLNVLKGEAATALYGARAANGAVIISTKAGQAKIDEELSQVYVRQNLQENAFFFPHLTTDQEGNISFTFTAPEALTRWKLQLLAHTKSLETATKTLYTVTKKDLMVIPNAPRFLRQGDHLTLSAKISNLSADSINGFVALQLFDAITGNAIDDQFENIDKNKPFQVVGKGNTEASWTLQIPDNVEALQYKIVAKAGSFSDGEQSVLPVLTNRMLVTETMPMWIKGEETKTFTLDKLKINTSTTLKNHRLTLEMTSNPAWYAVQALPYLMEYPYECAEQTFARYYANALASHTLNANSRVKAVFDQWTSAGALKSNLEMNEALKSFILQETPWLREARSETEQKMRMALLFDLQKMNGELLTTTRKMEDMQLAGGGFPWFKGSQHPNRYITQHIAAGYGHLRHLKVTEDERVKIVTEKAVAYLDAELVKDYQQLLDRAREVRQSISNKQDGINKEREFLEKDHLTPIQIHFLYMRSFYHAYPLGTDVLAAVSYYEKQTATHWKAKNLYMKGMIALVQHRHDHAAIAKTIMQSIMENAITSEELGMYWKENKADWRWNYAPIETQALLIEAFSEIGVAGETQVANLQIVDEMQIWLLKNKQTTQWPSTKATTAAVYALLLQGNDWTSITDMVDVQVGHQPIDIEKMAETEVEAGTGYFKTAWTGVEINPAMGEVNMAKKGAGVAWGALYWQYFEDLDKITSASTPLYIDKKLFLKSNTDNGEVLTRIDASTPLKVSDMVKVRIEIKVDREMDFVHMKDMRASGLEPINVLSEYKWQDGLGYYESTKDASTNFFFERLPKGIFVFEYDLRVNNQGNFSNGITTIQSMYAPEFSSHSEGTRIVIN